MYVEDLFVWSIGIGGALGFATALGTSIPMWRLGGNMAGLHVYSILYNFRETSSLEQRGVKVSRKDYWVELPDCFADPQSTRRNLDALFGG